MATRSLVTTIRPRLELEGDLIAIEDWAAEEGFSTSAVYNAVLAPLAYALKNKTNKTADGKTFVIMDFGAVQIKKAGEE